jgi:phosphoglycerate kinase
MVFTFFKSMGLEVGTSLVEEKSLGLARSLLKKAEEKHVQLVLPRDFVVADKFSNDARTRVVAYNEIEPGWMGLDIGPQTEKQIRTALNGVGNKHGTIFWNGPVGVFELPAFAHGTQMVAHLLARQAREGATCIVGGGDSVAAVNKTGLAGDITHLSTGGGASLELVEGKELPGVAALDDDTPDADNILYAKL